MWVARQRRLHDKPSEDLMPQFQAEPRSRKVPRPIKVVADAGSHDEHAVDPVASVRTALAKVDPFVREQIDTHPYRTVGAAVLVGFAIGGGFSSRIARFLVVAGVRYAARTFWRDIAATALGGVGVSEGDTHDRF
jgi:hypothetical protein